LIILLANQIIKSAKLIQKLEEKFDKEDIESLQNSMVYIISLTNMSVAKNSCNKKLNLYPRKLIIF
jgi:hypothetical protein